MYVIIFGLTSPVAVSVRANPPFLRVSFHRAGGNCRAACHVLRTVDTNYRQNIYFRRWYRRRFNEIEILKLGYCLLLPSPLLKLNFNAKFTPLLYTWTLRPKSRKKLYIPFRLTKFHVISICIISYEFIFTIRYL